MHVALQDQTKSIFLALKLSQHQDCGLETWSLLCASSRLLTNVWPGWDYVGSASNIQQTMYCQLTRLGPVLGNCDLSRPFSWRPGNSSCRLTGRDVGLLRRISSAAEAEDDVTAVDVRRRGISIVWMSLEKQTRFLCQSNKSTKYQFHNHCYHSPLCPCQILFYWVLLTF